MIEVRPATLDDATEFIRLNAAFNEVTLSMEQAEKNLREAKDRVLLAMVDGQVAGFACVLIIQLACYDEPSVEVTELYVEPSFRRQGVAKTLMQHAEALARASGAGEITICTGWDNMAGQQLYHGLGYKNDDVKLVKSL